MTSTMSGGRGYGSSVSRQAVSRVIVICSILAVICGIWFRVHAIDRKIYGFDETATQLRVAGATLPEYRRDLAAGKLPTLRAIKDRYQTARPGSSYADTVRALAIDDPQHAPLYFVLERAWQIFGTSIRSWRSLGVAFGIVLIPIVWWLTAEAFDVETASVAAALTALSPFHVLFAQYNREYGLWTVLTACSSGLLLLSVRRRVGLAWVAYAASLVAGLYTDPLFAYVVAAHALFIGYIAVAEREPRATVYCFTLAAVGSGVCFVPWLAIMVRQWSVIETTTAWNGVPLPPKLLATKWLFEIGNVFFDAEYGHIRYAPILALVLLIVALAAVVAMWKTPRRSAIFACLLILGPALPFVLGDVIFHESRSTAARYLTPVWIGLEVLVAAGLISMLRANRRRTRTFGIVAFASLLVAGVFSLHESGASPSWWIDTHDAPLVAIASELSKRAGAKLCYVGDSDSLLTLSDEVVVPVGVENRLSSGCFAVATSSEIALIDRRHGSFEPVGHGVMTSDIAELHKRIGAAHGILFEGPQLWQFRVRRLT